MLKKNKSPFYIELNNNIQACFLLFKPEPIKLNIINIEKFNFFFYKYIFYYIKKKNFLKKCYLQIIILIF